MEYIREIELASELGLPIKALRDFRTMELDEEEHYLESPMRYTEAGVQLVKNYFLGPPPSEVIPTPHPDVQSAPEVIVDTPRANLSPLVDRRRPPAAPGTVRPKVHRLPPNKFLVICNIGEYKNVRVHVGDSSRYVRNMEIPLDIDPLTFDSHTLLKYTGPRPRRIGCW